jgi:tetratricopeptide (TPR) repeat protein
VSDEPKQWWQTLPAIIGGIATLLTAVTGLLLALRQVGVFTPAEKKPLETPSPEASGTPYAQTSVAPAKSATSASQTFTYTDHSPLSDPQVNDAIRAKAMVKARKAVQQEATQWIANRLGKLGLATQGKIDANKLAIALLEVTTTQRDTKSGQEVETIALGEIDLTTFDQRAMPVLAGGIMDKLDEVKKTEEGLLNKINGLEETNKRLKSQLAGLSSAQQQKETAKLARESENVANNLKATELYRQALIQQELGRRDVSNRLLTQAIELAPDYQEARLARDSLEDAKYLVQHETTISPRPYFDVARDYLANGQVAEATQLFNKTTSLFRDKGVMIVELVYSPSEIDVNTITDSLTLEGLPHYWNQPPGMVRNSLTIVGKLLFVYGNSGLDLRKNDLHRLKFTRYGFKPVSIEAKSNDFTPGTLLRRQISIEATQVAAENTIHGRVIIVGHQDHAGITAAIYDNWNENFGFRKEGLSDTQGYFSISGIPDGRFQLDLAAPGCVHRDISIAVEKNIITCYTNEKGELTRRAKTPCNLSEMGLALYKIKKVHLKWMLQEDPTQRNFQGHISEGDVTLDAGLAYDWSRGGWGCCQSLYTFGTKQINGPNPDLLIYTALDGRIFFVQPYGPFITPVDEDYNDVTDVSKRLNFAQTEEVREGRTYVMTTWGKKFLVKLKVLSIE